MTGHIRQRSPGSWEIRYSLGTDPASGKRKMATATVRGSRKETEKELRRLLRALDTGDHVDPSRITVREWLSTWLDAVRAEVAPKTHERYGEIVAHFLAPALGNLQLTKLAPVHIQDAYSALATGGRRDGKEGGLSPRTRRHIHRILSASLTRAVEQQLIGRNPCDVFRKRLPKVERREMLTLTSEQSARLLEAVHHSHVYWPVLIALATGARRGEVLAIRWRNVDLEHGTLRIVESLEQTKTGLRFKSPKSDRPRAIMLPGFAIEELRRLKREQAERLLALRVRQTAETLLCCRADGEPLQPQSLTHEFPRFLARLGPDFPRVRFHDLRHTHATQLLLAGVHPKIAQERLGHSTVTTTLDLYSHVTTTMQEDAAARLDAAFRGAIKAAKPD
jgi:integrase